MVTLQEAGCAWDSGAVFLGAREGAVGLWAHGKLGGVVAGGPQPRPPQPVPGTLMWRHQRRHPHSLAPS